VAIGLALVMSVGLTRKLRTLTEAAGHIAQGDFSQTPQIDGRDEVGVLGKTISFMANEIQKLLQTTAEKARMESELKTARTVQESLFPSPPQFTKNKIDIAGHYMTSSECGGDWWHYFESGDDIVIVIGDATGHGVPPALVTSGARGVFSLIEQSPQMGLLDMAKYWDRAIHSTSGKKVFMTGALLRINTKTGKGRFVNASHEAPIIVKKDGDKFFCESFDPSSAGSTFGEENGQWAEDEISLQPGEHIFLFTDGLWALENDEGKTLSENRFQKSLARNVTSADTSTNLLEKIGKMTDEHRKDRHIPDDVTMVVIHFKES
jgi:sigma-B regulation protein RsbU (phosphoserine phosphatase)